MLKIPNINCIYYKRGRCNRPGTKKLLGLLKTVCPKVDMGECVYIKPHPKPPAPPPPPPKRIIREDIDRLTEGSVRGGMSSSCMKTTRLRPIAPPSPTRKPSQKEILKKVEQKEFVARCVAVDICPTCGYRLCQRDDGRKVCDNCNSLFSTT